MRKLIFSLALLTAVMSQAQIEDAKEFGNSIEEQDLKELLYVYASDYF